MIVFAVPDFDPIVGGTSRQTRLQAEAFARRGHDVCVLTRRLEGWLAPRQTVDGLEVVRVGPPGRGAAAEKRALLAVGRWLAARRRRTEIVQVVMWPDAAVVATLIGLAGRTALLWAIRGEIEHTLAARSTPLRRGQAMLRSTTLARVEHVVLTNTMSEEFAQVGLDFRSTVIPVPVDRAHFRAPTADERAEARVSAGVGEDTFVVVFVGHLQQRKAVDRLIDAIGRLRPTVPDVVLLIVGGARGASDDTEIPLRRQVEEEGLGDAVRFCGIAQDPRRFLWAADALALPSYREGMPNSLLEALASGLPCVAPPSAGGADVLTSETGIVPPSNEPGALAEALEELARDPGRRATMSKAALSYAERFDSERIAEEYALLYKRMANRSGMR